jgi:hypothetical protein
MKKKQFFLMMTILMMAFGFAGCPVSDDDDLDTGKNTEKKDPKVDKKSLEFSAEGGTQSVKVTTSGYKRYGFALDNADKSWLSAEIVSGKNTINITAKANTTGKERSATVKCYVTDVENSTDAQRVYLPVKVTQKANGTPSVSPTSLTFESSGSTQSVKVNTAGYKYCGCIIDDAAKSWLSRNYVSGGIIELTATPNTTDMERSTTIRCYATNAQKGTDDDTYFMNVKVTQKAKAPDSQDDLYLVDDQGDWYRCDGVVFDAYIAPPGWGKQFGDGWINENGKNEVVATGGHILTAHIKCSRNYSDSEGNTISSSLSFDISDASTLKSSNTATISNLKGEYKQNDKKGNLICQWKVAIKKLTTNLFVSRSKNELTCSFDQHCSLEAQGSLVICTSTEFDEIEYHYGGIFNYSNTKTAYKSGALLDETVGISITFTKK